MVQRDIISCNSFSMSLPSINEVTDIEFICMFNSSKRKVSISEWKVTQLLQHEHVQSMSGKAKYCLKVSYVRPTHMACVHVVQTAHKRAS